MSHKGDLEILANGRFRQVIYDSRDVPNEFRGDWHQSADTLGLKIDDWDRENKWGVVQRYRVRGDTLDIYMPGQLVKVYDRYLRRK